ncbi:MAG TPA: TRAP transporter small permease [Burkholderiales bacterium]|nr:TRAP transporter small permease [Burkholderiales bacterium]
MSGPARAAAALLGRANAAAAVLSAVATGIAGCVLTWEATARYLFKIPSDWQDELSVFLLVGATFLSAAWVQERRGHVGIQALSAVLPPAAERIRRFLSDVATLLFCLFFCWKSWSLLVDAVRDGQTSNSAWGAPLWIPYGCMAVGMTLVVFQVLLQVLSREELSRAG